VAVQLRERRLLDVAVEFCASALELAGERRFFLGPRHHEPDAELLRSIDRGERVLPPLDRADEQEVAVGPAARSERWVDGVGRDDDLGGWRSVQLHEITPRALRDREHPGRAPYGARDDGAEDEAVAPAHHMGVALE
jgi:hypothetical protein